MSYYNEERQPTRLVRRKVRKRKRRPFRRLLRLMLVLLVFLMLGGVAYAGYLAYKVKTTADDSYKGLANGNKSDLRMDKVAMGKDPVNILLMGVESYKGSPGHTDALMVLTVNPDTKEVAITSIPRDSRTYLPVIGRKSKITHAYAYGKKGHKEEATIDAVENFLDVPIDYYVRTNFQGFKEVVNSVGGIDVNVPFDFDQKNLKGKKLYFHKGKMHLNGDEALTYVQMRKQDKRGDFGRQDRQRQAMEAVAHKALSIKSISRADNLLQSVGSNVQTNISLKELFGMRNFYSSIQNKKLEQIKIGGQDEYINGQYFFEPDPATVQKASERIKEILDYKGKGAASSNSNGDSSELGQDSN
ncbi:LCP family protein [Fictibacillus enclensis]|uniref:LCP family protein n=1 Tax=Fictibacillus enclensis TaxID=1017270 RepID=UPI0024C03429|nr:LCP family protein [Fictibacillus enclensis]WHY71607.1 LCP family protein [Fictibacillus enclensis]